MEERKIIFEVKNNVGKILINRPKTLNAVDKEMRQEILRILGKVKEDAEIRILYFIGAGNVFSSGVDLKGDPADNPIIDFSEIIRKIRYLEKPVIAAVNGYCVGVMFGLALACDIILASSNAKFSQAFSKIGLSPDGGSTFFLPHLIGIHKAKEIAFSAEMFTVDRAYELGIVNKVIPAEQFEEEIRKYTENLARGPTLAYARTKIAMNKAFETDFETALKLEIDNASFLKTTEDYKEGKSAFKEKREPKFKGK